jgi:hypothetical protein
MRVLRVGIPGDRVPISTHKFRGPYSFQSVSYDERWKFLVNSNPKGTKMLLFCRVFTWKPLRKPLNRILNRRQITESSKPVLWQPQNLDEYRSSVYSKSNRCFFKLKYKNWNQTSGKIRNPRNITEIYGLFGIFFRHFPSHILWEMRETKK